MRILIATDSFKESLSSREAGEAIGKGLQKILKDTETEIIPVADGGEGTVEAIVEATKGRIVRTEVHDPLMRKISSFYGITGDGKTAVIEMAAASGLALLKREERNPLITTSFGMGELICDAIGQGCKTIITGIGGSATNDGGAGMISALGAKLLDKWNQPAGICGGELQNTNRIDISELLRKTEGLTFITACDVTNPLTGADGATRVFGPQKGAGPDTVEKLEKNLVHYAGIIRKTTGKNVADIPGSGAAGGMGAALIAFLNAEIKPGFEVVSQFTGLEEKIKNADLIITGEGKIDFQTRFGKTPQGVALLAKKYNKPVIAVAGTLGEKWETLYDLFDVLISITDKPMSLDEALQNASHLCENTGEFIGRMKLLCNRL